jgi:hypothetical protein
MQTTYDIKPLLSRAKRFAPLNPEASASGFSRWVYGLSHNPDKRKFTGNIDHQRRSQSRPFLKDDVDTVAQYLANERKDGRIESGWSLVYADSGKETDEIFVASRLVVGNKTLKCRPDGVMWHKDTGEILIIERKITTRFEPQIPKQSWPNIRAQLWCYAWIDDWANAKRITLMDEVWRRNKTTGEPSPPKVRRFWEASDEIWQESEKLFLLYGGKVINE